MRRGVIRPLFFFIAEEEAMMPTHEKTPTDRERCDVRCGHISSGETSSLLRELLDRIDARHAQLVFVFFGASHDPRRVADVLLRTCGPRAIGCTSAGELGCEGFSLGGMSAVAIGGDQVRASIEVVPRLKTLSLLPLTQLPDALAKRIGLDGAHDAEPGAPSLGSR